jgi:hypothetical protein
MSGFPSCVVHRRPLRALTLEEPGAVPPCVAQPST